MNNTININEPSVPCKKCANATICKYRNELRQDINAMSNISTCECTLLEVRCKFFRHAQLNVPAFLQPEVPENE